MYFKGPKKALKLFLIFYHRPIDLYASTIFWQNISLQTDSRILTQRFRHWSSPLDVFMLFCSCAAFAIHSNPHTRHFRLHSFGKLILTMFDKRRCPSFIRELLVMHRVENMQLLHCIKLIHIAVKLKYILIIT